MVLVKGTLTVKSLDKMIEVEKIIKATKKIVVKKKKVELASCFSNGLHDNN